MDPEFLNTDGEHEHDQSVTSVGIAMDGAVDLARLNAWLGPLVETRGVDIYRMKGVLAVAGQDLKYRRPECKSKQAAAPPRLRRGHSAEASITPQVRLPRGPHDLQRHV